VSPRIDFGLVGSTRLNFVSVRVEFGSVQFRYVGTAVCAVLGHPGTPICIGLPNTISYGEISSFECGVARKLTSMIV